MRIKTFASTYLLIIVILFTSLSVVSVYLNNSQMNMLRGQAERDFQRISATLARDISVLYGRTAGLGMNFSVEVDSLVRGYARYYRDHNINISLTDLSDTMQNDNLPTNTDISFIQQNDSHFVHIAGNLPGSFNFYRLNFYLDVTDNIENMRNIQRVLLTFIVAFSVLAAVALYLILSRIFKPLDIIAGTSRKIADEHYRSYRAVDGNFNLI